MDYLHYKIIILKKIVYETCYRNKAADIDCGIESARIHSRRHHLSQVAGDASECRAHGRRRGQLQQRRGGNMTRVRPEEWLPRKHNEARVSVVR